MEPAGDSDEESTIRYAGYTAVMLAPEHLAIDHVQYAQLGEDDTDIQAPHVNPDANGNHVNGNHVDTLDDDDDDDDDEENVSAPSKPTAVAPTQPAENAPRPILSATAPMEAARVSEVLEAMAGIQLRAPPAWVMGSEWQASLRGRLANLKAPASSVPAPTTISSSNGAAAATPSPALQP